jgi:hypothetical protein
MAITCEPFDRPGKVVNRQLNKSERVWQISFGGGKDIELSHAMGFD